METWSPLWWLIAVLLTAFLFAPLGLGGGMLFVPILHYLADWPLDTATLAVSLLLTLSVSPVQAPFITEGLIDLATVPIGPFARPARRVAHRRSRPW